MQQKGGKMPNIDKLNEVIKESGMTVTAIANKSGINRMTLYNRMNGKGEFTISEVVALTRVLHMDTDTRNAIFFANEVV